LLSWSPDVDVVADVAAELSGPVVSLFLRKQDSLLDGGGQTLEANHPNQYHRYGKQPCPFLGRGNGDDRHRLDHEWAVRVLFVHAGSPLRQVIVTLYEAVYVVNNIISFHPPNFLDVRSQLGYHMLHMPTY